MSGSESPNPGMVRGAKSSSDAAQYREEMIQAILDAVIDAIITIDEHGVIESFNIAAERMFQYSSAEAIGQEVSLLLAAPGNDLHDDFLERYLRSSETRVFGGRQQLKARRKDGTVFPIDLGLSELAIDERRYLGIVRDLSDKQQLEEEVLRSQKMEAVGRLASGLAHNYNNLLSGIAGCCHLILKNLDPANHARPYVEEIARAVVSGAAITRELLSMGVVTTTQSTAMDLNALVLRNESILRGLIAEDVALTVTPSLEGAHILAMPGRIEQVLMNLVVNARDAMPRGGELRIEVSASDAPEFVALSQEARAHESWVCLRVSDTGCGMDAQTKWMAFEPFFTTKSAEGGTGLGLSCVHGIVRQHGGYIRLESQPGEGCTFYLYFPAVSAPHLDPVAFDSAADVAGKGETILLVEDDRLVRLATRVALTEAGFKVHEAEKPSAAIAIASAPGQSIDLVLTDMVLPEMDGSELAVHLRSSQPQAQTLFMSAYPARLLIAQGRIEPGTALIEKPFPAAALIAKIRELLDAGVSYS